MVEAGILTTKMIHLFSPKYVIMSGVAGGRPKETDIGDVLISTKVFTIDTGKLDDTGFHPEIEQANSQSPVITKIRRYKNAIESALEEIKTPSPIHQKKTSIHFGPIACVRYVVDKEGFFAEELKKKDRKTVGLEMESYGVARACELSSLAGTKAIIIKSVMDNTSEKTDEAKEYAAWTSAQCVNYILAKEII